MLQCNTIEKVYKKYEIHYLNDCSNFTLIEANNDIQEHKTHAYLK